MAQKGYNFLTATESRRIAIASKKDSTAMMTISILGAFFLPYTFIAVSFLQMLRYMEESDTSKSLFSMSFFYREGAVAPSFWMYWAVTIPLTLIILVAWWFWCRREERFQEEFERRLKQSMLEKLASQ
jgi:hypothetical protein